MFHFNFDNTNKTQFGSTQVKSNMYEDLLVQICSLPLKSNTRQLQMPEFIQNEASVYQFLGEQFLFNDDWKWSQVWASPLNEVWGKMNSDSFQACYENTFNETFDAQKDDWLKPLCGEDFTQILNNSKWSEKSEVESNNKPYDTNSSTESQVNLAKLLDMPVEEQKKKGLFGLQFKVVKIANEGTKRQRTKFVCTFDNCGKICENKWSFLDHNRHHTGDKPYECKVCKKRFTQRGNLKQHVAIHKN